tara:strand:- start:259 stop:1416 length:1158 start_codon:yes stop_codon:yes gene_type:complete
VLALLMIIAGGILATKYARLPILLGFWFFCLCLIMLLGEQGVEAAFQISGKPSDTDLYYDAFQADFDSVSTYLFFHYPLFLKGLVFPFNNAYFALLGQCAALSLFCLLALRDSPNIFYVLVLLNHTVIYTCTNFFKDNYMLILMLFCIAVLVRIQQRWLKSVSILLCILLMAYVRPFALLFIPLAAVPYMFANSNKVVRALFWILGIGTLATVLVTQWGRIVYVASNWAVDASVGSEGLSIASLPKVILGPTPFHYLHFEEHFVQPLLGTHAILLTLLHFVFYAALSYFVVLFALNFSMWKKTFFNSIPALFSMSVSLGILVVYMVAYGSADIRQRAVILSLLFIAIALPLVEKKMTWQSDVAEHQIIWMVGVFSILFLMSAFAQ